MPTSVFCLAADNSAALAIVDALRVAGLRGSDVSVVIPVRQDPAPARPPLPLVEAHAGAAAAVCDRALATSMRWLMGMGTLAIPGFGRVIAAGPILAILSGPGNGTRADGLAGALIGHGIPAVVARRFERPDRDGQVLIMVHAIDGTEVDTVMRLMERHQVEHIYATPDAKPAAIASSIREDQERNREPPATAPGQEQAHACSQR